MKQYKDSTLMGMTKKDLLEQLRTAEHNQRVAEAQLNQHIENVKDWLPVRLGHWIVKQTSLGCEYTVCSSCQTDFKFKTNTGTLARLDMRGQNYCPNCGAKMEEAI